MVLAYLEDFGDISQVEGVVELRWLCFKFNRDLHVHIDRSIDDCTCHAFHGVLEPRVEEPTEKGFEDLEEDFPRWLRHAEQVEVSCEARGKRAATATGRRRTHAENRVLDVLPESFFSVIQSSFVYEETQEFYRRLRAVLLNGGHVDIIDEHSCCTIRFRAEQRLLYLLQLTCGGGMMLHSNLLLVTFNGELRDVRRSLCGEDKTEVIDCARFLDLRENRGENDRLPSAAETGEIEVFLEGEQPFREEAEAHSV